MPNRIQHKRGPNAPTGNSGITAGEFAIQLGTGACGPINIFIGISGSSGPVRVGTRIVENFNLSSNNSIPTTLAVSDFVAQQFASQVLGVCFMEGPVAGQGTIDIQQSLGGSGSGFSGLIGITFAIAFTKTVTPSISHLTDENGMAINHRVLLGDTTDGLAPKIITAGSFLGFIGACGGDVTVDQFGRATIVGTLGANLGGLGFGATGQTYGEVPIWMESGWTAARLRSGTGISVNNSINGITLELTSLSPNPAGTVGSANDPVEIPSITIDEYGRVTSATDAKLDLYKVENGFTGYVRPILQQYFINGSTFFEGNSISSNFTNNEIILTNTGITGIQVNGTYYTGGIVLSAGSGITLSVSGSDPETITIGSLGVVGASGYISLQGHTQGNVYLVNPTGPQNLVITKGGFNAGFDPVTGKCGYAVYVGLSSGIELPSNIPTSNAFISIPTGFTGFGGFGGVCFGSQVVVGGTGGARGFLEVNRIQATGSNKITGFAANSIAGTVLEFDARGGTEAGRTLNTYLNGRNAKIVLASFPSDQWNLVTDINGNYDSASLPSGYRIGGPNRSNPLPGLSATANAIDIEAGTVRLYKNARVEKHLVVGGNLYVIGNYFDNTGATVDFTKIAYISNNNFAGTLGQNQFLYPTGATFGSGILNLGASGTSGHDVGILFNAKFGNSGPTAGFFGFDSSAQAFTLRTATTISGITYLSDGSLNLDNATLAPFNVGSINGITLGLHSGTTGASISLQPGHRLGLCGPFGLTFSVSANNNVVIPAEATQPTTLVNLTTTQTMTNKTLGDNCVIDCGTY